jgi:UDP-arabinose 4-epimerase
MFSANEVGENMGMTKRVLVTGGAGYVGSHCCKAFAEDGWEVVVYDNLSRGWRDFVRWGPLIEGDILNEDCLRKAMRDTKPDIVAHFAAVAYIGESTENPSLYYRINSMGALSVLDAIRAANVPAMLFSSTCASYGLPNYTPIDEEHPQCPINPYGWSKLIVEKMLADCGRAHGIRSVPLRYFNAAGADPAGEIGERHEPETHVIPLAIRGVLENNYTFTILGDDFDTRDGTAVRDYVHVADLADAHCKALGYLRAGGESAAFNLGTGVGTTVAEVVAAVERIAGRELPRKVGPRRPGDPPALVASAGKARSVLDWIPIHSDIDTIVSTAWRWHAQGD